MYGTVSQLCNRLKAQFQGDQKITLIIWRKEDVMIVMDEDHVTAETTAEIVCDLATRDRSHLVTALDLFGVLIFYFYRYKLYFLRFLKLSPLS